MKLQELVRALTEQLATNPDAEVRLRIDVDMGGDGGGTIWQTQYANSMDVTRSKSGEVLICADVR